LREQAALEPTGYITTGAAAADLGVSPNTVKKWVRLGSITDVWALPGSGYLKIARSEIERIRTAGTPTQEAKG
jgi:predicted site-specific integrase-resolvase